MIPLVTAAVSATVYVLGFLFAATCVLMILLILAQKPRGGGLSGAFGGGGGSAQSAFGSKTGEMLTWVTVTFFVGFVLLAIGLKWTIDSGNAPATQIDLPASTAPLDDDQSPSPDESAAPPDEG
jgi:preprotein translocase subunit SecG